MKKAIPNYPVYTSHDWMLVIVFTVLLILLWCFCGWWIRRSEHECKEDDVKPEDVKIFYEEILYSVHEN